MKSIKKYVLMGVLLVLSGHELQIHAALRYRHGRGVWGEVGLEGAGHVRPRRLFGEMSLADRKLLKSAEDGDMAGVQAALDEGAKINVKNYGREATALHLAKNIDIVRLLVAAGADVNARDNCENTPLHAHKNNVEVVRLLLDNKADVHARNKMQQTPLYGCNSCDAIDAMLEEGAAIDAVDFRQTTVLHNTDISVEVLSYLIARGTDQMVHKKNHLGESPLHVFAKLEKQKDAVKALMDANADVNVQDKLGGRPLHDVGSAAIAQLLVDSGADVSATDHSGCTPLHRAKKKGVVSVLAKAGASFTARSLTDDMPLHVICAAVSPAEKLDVLDEALAHGADVKAKGKKGKTALQMLVEEADIFFDKTVCNLSIAKLIWAGSSRPKATSPELRALIKNEFAALEQERKNSNKWHAKNGPAVLQDALNDSGVGAVATVADEYVAFPVGFLAIEWAAEKDDKDDE